MRIEFQTADHHACGADEAPTYFAFECPRHPGRMCDGLIIRGNPAGYAPPNSTWLLNAPDATGTPTGTPTSPTFSPSINCKAHADGNPAEKYAGYGAHGFIEHGAWRNA